ncbi:MAG: hypothetical protein QG656_2741 [Candidatus Hydrogenedentes bacterium]|nr:hypothetical protein [Candidatus Hydrogenedentota bacterium]
MNLDKETMAIIAMGFGIFFGSLFLSGFFYRYMKNRIKPKTDFTVLGFGVLLLGMSVYQSVEFSGIKVQARELSMKVERAETTVADYKTKLKDVQEDTIRLASVEVEKETLQQELISKAAQVDDAMAKAAAVEAQVNEMKNKVQDYDRIAEQYAAMMKEQTSLRNNLEEAKGQLNEAVNRALRAESAVAKFKDNSENF